MRRRWLPRLMLMGFVSALILNFSLVPAQLLMLSEPLKHRMTPLSLGRDISVPGSIHMAQPKPTATPQLPYFWKQARVSIVWPHDGQGHPTDVTHSRAVNVSVWPSTQVSCTQEPLVTLWMAKNNDPLRPLPVKGQMILRTVNGITFPSMEFNNIPADLVAEPTARFYFSTAAVGSNIWVHAIDARTILPHPLIPVGIEPNPGLVDARIQIVWPHDEQGRFAPVDRAPFVNIAFDLFAAGTLNSVPVDYQPADLDLIVGEGNAPTEWKDWPAIKTTYEANGQTFPRWVFNDVPVQPGRQYHFMVAVWRNGKAPDFSSSVWTHALDARTFLPRPKVPPPCRG